MQTKDFDVSLMVFHGTFPWQILPVTPVPALPSPHRSLRWVGQQGQSTNGSAILPGWMKALPADICRRFKGEPWEHKGGSFIHFYSIPWPSIACVSKWAFSYDEKENKIPIEWFTFSINAGFLEQIKITSLVLDTLRSPPPPRMKHLYAAFPKN